MRDLRNSLLIASLLSLLLPLTARAAPGEQQPPAAADDATAYETVDVSEAVVMAVHRHGSNITCLRHRDGLVFVDASLSTRLAARFRADMERRFGVPTRALVLTHAHLDHVLGMGAFADVPVIAAQAGRPFLEQLATYAWGEQEIAGTTRVFPTFATDVVDAKPFVPTVAFEDDYRLGTEDDPLFVRRTGGHTTCSSNVWWPAAKLVVTGDLVQARRRPYFGEPSTDLVVWTASLQGWLDEGATRFCPGHGPLVGRDEISEIRSYFLDLTAALAALKSRGVALETAMTDPSLPTGYWPPDETTPRWWPSCLAAAWRGL